MASSKSSLRKKALNQGHRNLNKPYFNPSAYAEEFRYGVEKEEEAVVKLPMKNVQMIGEKYIVERLIGQGAFGVVYKCSSKDAEGEFAIKVMNLTDGLGTLEQKRAIESSYIELDLLTKLKHPNIVKYIEHLYLEEDPSKPSKKLSNVKEEEKKKNFLCVVMEYVRGSDLEKLLSYSEKNRLHIPCVIAIKWFIEVLEVLNYCHKNGVTHRDIKPDNILVAYETLDVLEKMKLILTDFGVGKSEKDTPVMSEGEKEEDEDTPENNDLFGHLFYAPPEVLDKEKGDEKYDMFSLAILFFQLFFGVTTESYQKQMNKLKTYIRRNQDVRRKFNTFVLKTGGSLKKISILTLLSYIHHSGLFKEHILRRFIKGDKAFSTIIEKMVCEKKDRITSTELLQHKTIKTWTFLLRQPLKELKDFGEENIDIRACISVVRILKGECEMYHKILSILYAYSKKSPKMHDEVKDVLKEDGVLSYIIGKIILFDREEEKNVFYMARLLNEFLKGGELTEKISRHIRDFCITDLLRKYCVESETENKPIFYIFTYFLIRDNATVMMYFKEILVPLLNGYFESRDKVLARILQLLIPTISFLEIDIPVANLEHDDDLILFKNLKSENMNLKNREMLVNRIFLKIQKIMKVLGGTLEQNMSRNLKLFKSFMKMVVMLMWIEQPPKENLMNLKGGEEYCDNIMGTNLIHLVEEEHITSTCIDEMTNRLFYKQWSDTSAKGDNHGYVITNQYLGKFEKSQEKEEEEALIYYEMKVIDGGVNDMVGMGVCINKKRFVYLQANKIYLIEEATKEIKVSTNSYYPQDFFEDDYYKVQSLENLFKKIKEDYSSFVSIRCKIDDEWIDISIDDEEEWESIPTEKEFFHIQINVPYERKLIKELEVKNVVKYCSGDVVGMGVTSKGNIFYTRNGERLPLIDVAKYMQEGDELCPFFHLEENDFFNSVVVLGDAEFVYYFKNVEKIRKAYEIGKGIKKKFASLGKKINKMNLEKMIMKDRMLMLKIAKQFQEKNNVIFMNDELDKAMKDDGKGDGGKK